MITLVVKIYVYLLDIFFPHKCIICGTFGNYYCDACVETVEKIYTATCPECGKISKNSKYCTACRNKVKPSINSIAVTCSYQSETVKKLIHDFKYLGITALSECCVDLMYQKLSKQKLSNNLVIVPVPLHRYKYNRRGFNQSELLARGLSDKLKAPGGNALLRHRNTRNQVGLKRHQRLSNLFNAFSCVDPELVIGKEVLLVDDVMTTGTTLNECAKVLRSAGAKKVFGIVLARNL